MQLDVVLWTQFNFHCSINSSLPTAIASRYEAVFLSDFIEQVRLALNSSMVQGKAPSAMLCEDCFIDTTFERY